MTCILLTLAIFAGCSGTNEDTGRSQAGDTGVDTEDTGAETDTGPTCGDGIVDGDEACDDGNEEDLDGCDNDCAISEDICAGVSCDAIEAVCDENVAVAESPEGTCVVVGGEPTCEHDPVEAVDCSALGNGHYCEEAACVSRVAEIEGMMYWVEEGAHATVLMSDGTLYTLNETELTLTEFTGVKQAAKSWRGLCVLQDDDTVWCQGDNTRGQLGTGDTEPVDGAVQLPLPADVVPASVSSTLASNVVLTESGDVLMFGDYWDGVTSTRLEGDVVADDIVFLSQGEFGPLAIDSAGSLILLGDAGWGSVVGTPISGMEVEFASQAWDTSGGVRAGGQVWHLGKDGGVAGNGPSEAEDTGGEIVDVIGLTNGVDVAHSLSRRCALLDDGDVKCWGWQETPSSLTLPEGVRMKSIEASSRTIFMVSEDGHLYTNGTGSSASQIPLPTDADTAD